MEAAQRGILQRHERARAHLVDGLLCRAHVGARGGAHLSVTAQKHIEPRGPAARRLQQHVRRGGALLEGVVAAQVDLAIGGGHGRRAAGRRLHVCAVLAGH